MKLAWLWFSYHNLSFILYLYINIVPKFIQILIYWGLFFCLAWRKILSAVHSLHVKSRSKFRAGVTAKTLFWPHLSARKCSVKIKFVVYTVMDLCGRYREWMLPYWSNVFVQAEDGTRRRHFAINDSLVLSKEKLSATAPCRGSLVEWHSWFQQYWLHQSILSWCRIPIFCKQPIWIICYGLHQKTGFVCNVNKTNPRAGVSMQPLSNQDAVGCRSVAANKRPPTSFNSFISVWWLLCQMQGNHNNTEQGSPCVNQSS